LLDVHGRAVHAVAGQAAGTDHAPESFVLHEESGLISQGVAEAVVLMRRMHHDVGAVERRAIGIVIEERAASCKHIPGIVEMKIEHPQPEREVDAGDRARLGGDGHELSLREDLPVIVEFFLRVRGLGGIDEFADLDDRGVIRRGEMADTVVGGKHT
jgi:hypothetical protein